MATVPEEPLGSALYSAQHLETFARELAYAQRVVPGNHRGRPIRGRLRSNRRAIQRSCRALAADAHRGQPISPAAEWLLDNFALVDEQIRQLQGDLGPGFYRELPKLVDGLHAGFPRVFALAWAYVEHTGGRVDPDTLRRFVIAYQTVHPLTMGELWAVAISLRVVLVENLRRLACQVVDRRVRRSQADNLADALLSPTRGAWVGLRMTWLARSPLSVPFAARLVERLHDLDPETAPGLLWLHEQLARHQTTADEAVRIAHLQQVETLRAVRDDISSLRVLSRVEWRDFVEDVSLVEETLRDGAPPHEMDFATRDRYRHAVEALARRSDKDELAVARAVARRARAAGPGRTRERDPGYWLIATGRTALEEELGYRPPWSRTLVRALPLGAVGGYLGSSAAGAVVVLGSVLAYARHLGASPPELVAMGLVALLPASELAIATVNRAVAWLQVPRALPKLELEDGVPAALRTLVVVPSLLTGADEVRSLVERLEVHFLANDDDELRFALVTDWCDASSEHGHGDDALLAQAREGVDDLNATHASTDQPIFFLLHRGRRWNARQERWMGWERKRGKLHELDRLLRGAEDTTFLATGPTPSDLAALRIRYVITLDADTKLPLGAARRLVSTIAHPLNQAVHDPKTGLVVSGYGILQPRVTPTLPEVGRGTLTQRIFAGSAGVDPYAFAVSDVYQDLFGEGSYTGKGIYDLDAFERALAGQVPDNTMLSHDLFEGLYARAALVSDVEVFESYPAQYPVAAVREHRWARGDWQLLPWIAGRGPLGVIGRWKMLDNLRRTLVPVATLATLLTAWLLPDGRAWLWTGFILATVAIPTMTPVLLNVMPSRAGLALRPYARQKTHEVGLGLARVGLSVALLVDEARRKTDAIARTLFRMATGRGPMLEWVTGAEAARTSVLRACDLKALAMSFGVASAVLVIVGGVAPHALPLVTPFVLVWGAAPLIVWWISRPPRPRAIARLDRVRADLLRQTARRSWRYFETFVTAADHHLPPDNVQEDPAEAVAHRTSPTNIGLYLLSAVAAHDMGWLGTRALIDRLDATLTTLEQMERHRGHFYNWYDTLSLSALQPRYVSTVDSGNLAGHLIVVQQACLELAAGTPSLRRQLDGVADVLNIARQAMALVVDDHRDGAVQTHHLALAAAELAATLRTPPAANVWEVLTVQADVVVDIVLALGAERGGAAYQDTVTWAEAVRRTVVEHADASNEPVAGHLKRLAERAGRLFREAEWDFVFDPSRKLFATGFDVSGERLDAFDYDLLASECRLASFVAIAKGDVPVTHWFHLGRRISALGSGSALLSWSGSMFEYLMPGLVMAEPDGSLLASTAREVVAFQIRHGRALGLPWGVSESAYNARDLNHTYQYGSFGLAGLGIKRGLGDDLVVAPYATALAAMVDPAHAADNLVALARVGASGHYGYYEAVDYTAARLPEDRAYAVVKAYFAHHQGMSIVALCNVVDGFPMRRRFHAAPIVQATELLLHERSPRDVAVARPLVNHDDATSPHARDSLPPALHQFDSPHQALPATQRLSNGRYSVTFTAAGSGQSLWRDLAVTRWREDSTLDGYGTFVFVRDVHSGEVWSAGHQPAGVEADRYQAAFHEHRVEIKRRDGAISTHLDVVIATDADAELRQVTLHNHGMRTRTFDLTSYAEVVLAPDAADVAHRAFSNLFVETSFEPSAGALVATRRPRSPGDQRVWAAHVSAVHGVASSGVQFETDRARFIGRGRELRTASVIHDARPLSNTVGAVLDPIFSLRRRVVLGPGETAMVLFATLVDTDRARLVTLCDAYRDAGQFERCVDQAWTHAQVQLRHLGVDAEEAQLFQRLGARVMYADPSMRAPRDVLERNQLGHAGLWKFGISGDLPIVMGRIQDGHDPELVRQLVRAHCYWLVKGMRHDLVLLDEQDHTYSEQQRVEIERLVRSSHIAGLHNGVHLIRADQIAAEDRDLLLTAARVVVQSRDGTLSEQMLRRLRHGAVLPPPPGPAVRSTSIAVPPRHPELEFFNGIGGFSAGGRDYVTVLGTGQWTPLPWVNVIANPSFGFLVSEAGSGYTWAENSRENQLTPWSNDPMSDAPGEVVYVRDDDTGELWTATPLPIREDSGYVVYHGQGFTSFVHESHEIALELVQFVAPDEPVKYSRLRLRNTANRERHISVAAYVEWILGPLRAAAIPFVVTSIDPATGAMFARNRWKAEFADRVAFLDIGGDAAASSGDRTRWIGRNGSLATPAGLAHGASGAGPVGPGLDPCGMLMRTIVLPPRGKLTVVVVLGQAASEDEARRLVLRARESSADSVLEKAVHEWDSILGVVQVKTPDRAMDVLLNRWLLYQTLSCRLWARAGFYQAGGAYGFRDQLQDCMALTITRPDLVREHLLRAAAHQFPQGDVQHWWHPPTGKGVRTNFSDDRIWLPYTIAHYMEATADTGVLEELVPFLDAPALGPGQADAYQEPVVSMETGSLYEHAARALDISLEVGAHGLPLMGGGDWNDGMNRVGDKGAGESVWLAWFQIATLEQWIPIAHGRGDTARETAWKAHTSALRVAVEAEAWDGDWYRRAFNDEGAALGSAENLECRIDSIAQSWSVFAGGREDRARQAMASVDEHLVRRADALVLLLTPPFDRTPEDPGYIKGYVPGVRENGGQYTHAAVWVVMAFAALGDGNRAGELFAMLNPIHHAATRAAVQRYKVEPYVVAADVYSAGEHVGRGGWTWYTGSAPWMYRAGLESILGVHVRGEHVHLAPCIPDTWPKFQVTLKHRTARYQIIVTNPNAVQHGISALTLDGVALDPVTADVPLTDDGRMHQVRVTMG